MRSPTWDAVNALIEELKNIRPGNGYNLDFGDRVFTKEPDLTALGVPGDGFLVVRFTEGDAQDTEDCGERMSYSRIDLAVDAWIPEASSDPGIASGLELACRAGDDIVKAVNIAVRARDEIKSAWTRVILRGTGAPGIRFAKAIVQAHMDVLIDFSSIGT